MNESYDREKIVNCMLDPVTSMLIAELEDGGKSSKYLAEKSSISENEVNERFSYLVTHGFILKNEIKGEQTYSANLDKLTEVVEEGGNFGAAIEGLEKMDSFLN